MFTGQRGFCNALCALGLLLVVVAGPLLTSDLGAAPMRTGCSGTATLAQGLWDIQAADCGGTCPGTANCEVRSSGNYKWCGCSPLKPACCYIRITISPNGVEKAGSCPACGLKGGCDFDGNPDTGPLTTKCS